MRALVTGAAGFVGSALCARMAASGLDVIGTSRRCRPEAWDLGVWRTADCSNPADALQLLKTYRPDVVFHLASHVTGSRALREVLPTFASNVATTVNLLAAAADVGIGRFVLAGSLEEPEGNRGALVPASPYAVAKWTAHAYSTYFHAAFGVPAVHARIFMVYGPGCLDERKLVPYTITSLLRRQVPEFSSGTRLVDWVFIEDVVDGLMRLGLNPGVEGMSLDIGTGQLTSVRSVVEQIRDFVLPGADLTSAECPIAQWSRSEQRMRCAALGPSRGELPPHSARA